MSWNDYATAKQRILSGEIKTFPQLLEFLYPSSLARHMRSNPGTFKRAMADPGLFRLRDSHTISQLIGVPQKTILDMMNEYYLTKQPEHPHRKKKPKKKST